ncbi:transcriptional regulator [Bhargavaea cecembensis]|uniref:Transcriptional regulator n=1 Tax=Bhargavaea cecembensis TaxID=394098 RepID=A0A165H8A7_9BACL|nr:transcriptional regulator [Bhargavaea cecembensis]
MVEVKENTRKDRWTPEDDRILADTVIESVKNGGTQLGAFADAAEKLGRTKQACGFRWNKTLRKIHSAELEAAQKKPEHHLKSHLKQAMSGFDELSESYMRLKKEHEALAREHHRLLAWLSKGVSFIEKQDS